MRWHWYDHLVLWLLIGAITFFTSQLIQQDRLRINLTLILGSDEVSPEPHEIPIPAPREEPIPITEPQIARLPNAVLSPELEEIFCTEIERAEAGSLASRIAAKIWVESRFNSEAISPVGAEGWGQFMPRTAKEWAAKVDPSCEGVPASDPACSARMTIAYTRQTIRWAAITSLTNQDMRAKADAAYNGGIGNLRGEEGACKEQAGCDESLWWDNVESVCLRRPSACTENRQYPVKINRVLRDVNLMRRLPECGTRSDRT